MFYGMIKELLKEKTIWVVLDEGWFYSKPLAVFFDKSSAIAYWEVKTLQTYSDEKYIEIAQKSYSSESHWYYGLEEYSLKDIFQYTDDNLIKATISDEADAIRRKGNDSIADRAIIQERKRTDDILKGMIYYLQECGVVDTYLERDIKRKAFWDNVEKVRK